MSTQSEDQPVPHFAVIFSAQRSNSDEAEYAKTADRMVELAQQQPGYLSHESARGDDGFGMTISYWTDEEAIRAWKQNVEHLAAQRMGVQAFYDSFVLRIARVESIRTWNRSEKT